MSTANQQQPQVQADEAESGDEGIFEDEHKVVFEEVIEYDGRICNNCFALRELEGEHFRSSGGTATGRTVQSDQTADRFCTTCHAGTGKWSLHRPHEGKKILHRDDDGEVEDVEITSESGRLVDYSNVHCHLGERFISDMGGTVERDWGTDAPLPKNGELVSLFRNLARLRDRLEEKGHDVDWEHWKDSAETWKEQKSTLDRPIFARLVATTIEAAD